MIMSLLNTAEEVTTSGYSYPTQGLANFLWSAAPYIVGFFVVIFIVIAILKISLHIREKKLSQKPQNINRFDLDILPEEEQEGNDCP